MDYTLKDLVEINVLQSLCEKFSKLTQTVTAILDLDGNILVATGWQDICTKFHRVNLETASHCKESDTVLAKQLSLGKKYNVYKCKNGLIDVAVPIIIDGNHVGNFFTGQFFFEPPEREYFRRQAIEFGFDEDFYLEALSRVPILAEEHVKLTMDYLCELTEVVGSVGLKKLEVLKANEKLVNEIQNTKKVEEELLKQHAEFQAIFNSITDAIVFVDLDRRIIMVNPAFNSLLGYDSTEAIGKTTQFFYANPAEYNQQGEKRYRTKATIDNPVYEIEYRRKDGLIFPSETLGVPVKDVNGVIIGFLGVIRDLTDYKESEKEKANLERRLNQAQKMEAIGTLAGGIAHDFNNILSAILGFTELAKDECQPGSTISKDLDRVLEAGNRAKGLVQQILAFSRQEDVERISLQPASIVKATIDMLRSSLPTTIMINQNIAPQTGWISADPIQINQILINLCTNAFHAMEKTGGTLDISLKEVTLSSEDLVHEPDVADGAFIQLSIGDSGQGIAPILKDKIFNPYFTTKEAGKGTGMGLSIVHGIVKSYGGFISLYSELGEGTVFHVFLPVIEKEKLPENQIIDQIPTGKERILLIDDEEILVKMGKTMLERLGYHVTIRRSSLEALEIFQNQPDQFDLVITDQTMPGMTGSDLSRRMLQIRPDIPIILCTGYSTIISEGKAKSIGIKEFALKPLAMKDIAKLIRKVLDTS